MVEASRFDIPEELEGEYKCKVAGKALLYFDPESGRMVYGESAYMISARIEAPAPDVKFSNGLDETIKIPKNVRIVMDMDSYSVVELKPEQAPK